MLVQTLVSRPSRHCFDGFTILLDHFPCEAVVDHIEHEAVHCCLPTIELAETPQCELTMALVDRHDRRNDAKGTTGAECWRQGNRHATIHPPCVDELHSLDVAWVV